MSITGIPFKSIIAVAVVISASIAVYYSWLSDSEETILPPEEIEEYLFWNPKKLQEFTLSIAGNQQLTLDNLLGKWSFVFFGYTHCPDVCPVTLGVMSATVNSLEKTSDLTPELQGIFISVDPDRDSPEHLKQYTSYFHPKFIGATGTTAQIDAITRQMMALYAIHNEESKEHYLVSHNSTVFLIDPRGRLYGRFPPPLNPNEIARALTGIRTFYNAQESKRWSFF
ncbi:Cytochrome oxidase biogenesis protein Sco1/SenC/PrrC, thiol-disulfide reductase involved in Cu(I) insertion into CoxII Cu(A) center [hydrothermal vent metagenome]|uniref:Cytochrome oxidase biogenesis protein Sco1/SenC/PrrC, thiol-disulfide reductase involved in Cu(I) insertion into CoxII Cu(A) center n=1 Tax=hydrothermal vent metagenome TaxID=652676 RepID=A0A3B1AYW1_9ZZZZ